ncbi:MAG: ATP-dependent zinc metalloprotease FtsH [Eubacteriales bacterium]|nr:ATP-dependent zinc metalloprotease FtsH [Eubacteriales bacterium]
MFHFFQDNDNQNNNRKRREPNDPNRDSRNPFRGDNGKQLLLIILSCLMFSLLAYNAASGMRDNNTSEEITYNRFVSMVENNEVKSVEVSNDGTLWVKPVSSSGSTTASYKVVMVGDENGLNELLKGRDITYSKKSVSVGREIISSIVSLVIPLLIFFVGFNFIMRSMGRGGGMMGVGKSKAKLYVQQDTGVTFADVAGEEEAKESMQEVVDFLHNPAKYTSIGAKLPKGVLLVGPPGTGKTLLAKAVAGEAGVPFFSLSGSEFVEMFVGVGASRVRDLFEEAKKQAPCIVFIDEIDAIGKSRDSHYGGNDEREQTLNQLLAEMDGFDSSKALLILGATNRPEVLDKALLRPGRFDRRVIVDRPDLKGRISILKVHAAKVMLDETVDFQEIALATSGACGSDLANMVNEAAILAVKHGRKAVSQKDLLEAVEVVLVGQEKKERIMSKEERRIVSYHEVGHALVAALQKHAEPVQKITIVPRTMGALGYVMQVPEEEKYLNSKKELQAMIVGYLAGRAAEEIVFGDVTTGASNDIEKATQICKAMITQYGMSETFGLMGLARQEDQYLSGKAYMDCGDETAAQVDREIMNMLKAAYEEAKVLLRANRDVLDRIAGYLIVQETITGKEFMRIMNTVISEREQAADPMQSENAEKAEELSDGI